MRRAAVVVLPLALAGAACGGGGSAVDGAEAVIATAFAAQLAVDDEVAVVVTCPDDASLETGTTLVCDVAVGGDEAQSVPFAIGDGGRATLGAAVLPLGAAERHLAEQVGADADDVACGDGPLVVGEVGSTFTCEVVGATGPAQVYEVEITSIDGEVRALPARDGVATG